MQAVRVAEFLLKDVTTASFYSVLPSGGGWVVQCEEASWMGLLSFDLALQSEMRIPDEMSGRHAMSSDGRLTALSLEGRIVAVDLSGSVLWTVPVALGEEQMGSCWFLRGDSAISALVPGDDDMDVLILLDASSGEVLHRKEMDTVAAWSVQFGHVRSGWHGLTVGYGQDGSVSRWVDTREALDVVPAFDDACSYVGGISPNGRYYLTCPHPACEVLSVRAFPSSAEEQSTTESVLFGGERRGVQNAVYLDGGRILISPEGLLPMVLTSDGLRIVGSVEYPSAGERRVCGPQPADGTWATNNPETRTLERWILAD